MIEIRCFTLKVISGNFTLFVHNFFEKKISLFYAKWNLDLEYHIRDIVKKYFLFFVNSCLTFLKCLNLRNKMVNDFYHNLRYFMKYNQRFWFILKGYNGEIINGIFIYVYRLCISSLIQFFDWWFLLQLRWKN